MLISIKISRKSGFLGLDKPRMLFPRSQLLAFNIYEQEKCHAQLS